jgi:hypothetical protein
MPTKRGPSCSQKRGPSCPQYRQKLPIILFFFFFALCWPIISIWYLWYCFSLMPISAHCWLSSYLANSWPIIYNLAFVAFLMLILAHSWLSCKAHSWPILVNCCRCSKTTNASNSSAINHLLQC